MRSWYRRPDLQLQVRLSAMNWNAFPYRAHVSRFRLFFVVHLQQPPLRRIQASHYPVKPCSVDPMHLYSHCFFQSFRVRGSRFLFFSFTFSGYFQKTSFVNDAKSNSGEINFYDSNTGKLLFTAPKGRSMEEFLAESRAHGWPSFRGKNQSFDTRMQFVFHSLRSPSRNRL